MSNRAILDFFFPPFCLVCEEKRNSPFFCDDCWIQSAPLDPTARCKHCFEEIEKIGLCDQCREDPLLSIPSAFVFEKNKQTLRLIKEVKRRKEAMASYLFVQWHDLNWFTPDLILPLHSSGEIGAHLSDLMGVPTLPAFQHLFFDAEMIEEEQKILLVGIQKDVIRLKKIAKALIPIFPKKIGCLTLV